MNTWLDKIIGSEKILAIFKNEFPSLSGVSLHEIILSRNAGCVFLRFDLAIYPANPPHKWLMKGFNCVQVTLEFGEVRELSISNWTKTCVFDLNLSREGEKIRLQSENGPVQIKLIADFASLMEVAAYKNDVVAVA